MPEALVGARVVLESEALDDHAPLVPDGRVVAIVPASQVSSDMRIRELEPGYLTPALVDVHTHLASKPLTVSVVGDGVGRPLRAFAPSTHLLGNFDGYAAEAADGTVLEGPLSPQNATAVRKHLPWLTPQPLYMVTAMLRLGVWMLSFAPHYIGGLEKAVDYIGSFAGIAGSSAEHAYLARALGPYKPFSGNR